jgi:hypothetical protein
LGKGRNLGGKRLGKRKTGKRRARGEGRRVLGAQGREGIFLTYLIHKIMGERL